jgi:two-component system, NtrC family, sensor histidine kinase KinB
MGISLLVPLLVITIVAVGFAMLVAWHVMRLAEFRRTNVGQVLRAKHILESTLEALPDAVVVLDAACRVLSLNRAAVGVLHAAGVRNPGTLEDLHLDGLDRSTVAEAIKNGTNAPPVRDLTHTIAVERDGTVQRLLPRVVAVPGLATERAGAILLLYDVTDLVRLDQMRSELVAVASHELQTPLTTLRMTLLMLQEAAAALPAREQELVATSLIGVEQLSDTVHEFLDLTRIEAGELRLNVEAVHVPKLVREAMRRVEPQALAQGISLQTTIAPDLPPVAADQWRLRVVLDNLIANALKYTPSGGAIAVDAGPLVLNGRADGTDAVAISVSDTGSGVPLAFRRRIFDKFFRLDHQQINGGPHPGGAGIGLYVCREIVNLHGGRITCAPGVNDRGTTMTVQLPVKPPRGLETREPAHAQKAPPC